jgi:hypothetical protein
MYQTVLKLRLDGEPDAHIADSGEYGDGRSPHDDPTQVIWSHQASESVRYVKPVLYQAHACGGARVRRWWELCRWMTRTTRVLEPKTSLLGGQSLRARLAGRIQSP